MANTLDDGLLWLDNQLRALNIDDAELSRRSNKAVSKTTLSNLRSGNRGLGIRAARGIATGLGVPLEIVMREFGLTEADPQDLNEDAQLFVQLLEGIEDQEERDRAVGLVTTLLRHIAHQSARSHAEKAAGGSHKKSRTSGRAATSR